MDSDESVFTCVIIEDNEVSRLTLEHLVDMHPQLRLLASLPSGVEALTFFRSGAQTDILLLDIEMPHLSGLELISLLPEPTPSIVLVTTHTEFAVDAFDLQVVDFLVKPVKYARFSQAMLTVFKRRQAAQRPEEIPVENDLFAKGTDMFVKVQGKLLRIDFDDVLYLEALSTYAVLVTEKQKFIVGGTLKSIVERLPFQHFVRVHRSYVVNLHRVHEIQDNQLYIGAHIIPVGKSYQEEFHRRLRTL